MTDERSARSVGFVLVLFPAFVILVGGCVALLSVGIALLVLGTLTDAF